jgi:thioredoxin-like negative regulator of GroEL
LAVVDVDDEQSQKIASELRVVSIPSVFAYKDGKIIGQFHGDIGDVGVTDFVKKIMATK